MPGYIGELGKAALGKFELARAPYRRSGATLSASFEADGTCTVSWAASVVPAAGPAFECDGHSTASWTATAVAVPVFKSDGTCTVSWIAQLDAVEVTCITSDAVAPSSDPVPSVIWDAPAAY